MSWMCGTGIVTITLRSEHVGSSFEKNLRGAFLSRPAGQSFGAGDGRGSWSNDATEQADEGRQPSGTVHHEDIGLNIEVRARRGYRCQLGLKTFPRQWRASFILIIAIGTLIALRV